MPAPRAALKSVALALPFLILLVPLPALAAAPPCRPCAGLSVEQPFALDAALAEAPALADGARFYATWDQVLLEPASPAPAHALAARGATPWVRLIFSTPAPLLEHADALQLELDAAAAFAESRIPRAHFQIVWRPGGEMPNTATELPPTDLAFLVKRAAVALSGVDPDARILVGPLSADTSWLARFFSQEVAAYLDGAVFRYGSAGLPEAVRAVHSLAPGTALVLDHQPLPDPARAILAAAARGAANGFAVVLFESSTSPTAADLEPFVLLANEFQGDLSLDPGTAPTGRGEGGRGESWSFVRGEDLSLRVIAEVPPGATSWELTFPDSQLRSPQRVLPDGDAETLVSSRQAASLEVRIEAPTAVELLRLERVGVEELEGLAEEVTITGERQVEVAEILRRLQAVEDAQNRRLRHWQAINSTTLRFQAASGVQAVEATFEGEIFLRPGQPFDWAWQQFYLNGVRWRGDRIPELPLVQPEKAAALPLEILLTRDYRYELQGTARLDGRDCWVIDFAPATPVDGRTLFRGTVWVDRATHTRVRTRAVQLGLAGDVLSNEETIDYSVVDEQGTPTPRDTPGAFVLPLRTTGQQILSIVNATTVVERQVVLSQVRINGPEFDSRREAVLASDATMVRDTDAGLRYLSKDGAAPGERIVQEGFDTNRLFLLGGVFYDDSLDYPLPLAGVNWFDLDLFGRGGQLNAFFAGVLGTVSYAEPRFLDTRMDLGGDLFVLGVATADQLWRGEVEAIDQEVEIRPASAAVNAGLPLGSFTKLSATARLSYSDYGRTDDTAPEFVLPEDHTTTTFGLGLQFARSGYRLNLRGAWSQRSTWDFWGLPDSSTWDPAHRDYATWELAASKSWYLSGFRKFGLELNWSDGEDLDRFSKFQFGFFGGNRVHGYQIGKVRAESAVAAHVTYGFELGNLLRLEAVGDAAWATDTESGLDRELLAGVGVQGTFMGPWDTLVAIDIGAPVEGPDDGVVVYLVFLKLFD